jgi:hypothetical protein
MSPASVTDLPLQDRLRPLVSRGEWSQRSSDNGCHYTLRLSVAKDKDFGLSDNKKYQTKPTDHDKTYLRIATLIFLQIKGRELWH